MISPLKIPGAWMWSAWQPDRGMPFNSYLFERDGMVAVDPLPLDDETMEWLASRGGVRSVVLTNRDHRRGAQALRDRFGARVSAHELEAKLFDIPIDATFRAGDEVFPGAVALALPHGKTPGEVALYLRKANAAVVGDALIGAPAGALSLLADEKLENPQRALAGLRRLWSLRLDSLLLCDGQPLFAGADAALAALLEKRMGAEINRINLDELEYESDTPVGSYSSADAEVGLNIGARKIGYRVSRIEPGMAFCPLHWHVEEEEFFYVIEGTPSIRTSRGTLQCRPGDFIAFPTGARGAHQLRNDSAESCLVMLAGLEAMHEACFYPDSEKVLVSAREEVDLMVRSVPELDYFDGEPLARPV